MIELLNGLKKATLNLRQLRSIAFELVDGEMGQQNLNDRKVIEKICDRYNIARSSEQSLESLAESLCTALNLQFDQENDFDPRLGNASK